MREFFCSSESCCVRVYVCRIHVRVHRTGNVDETSAMGGVVRDSWIRPGCPQERQASSIGVTRSAVCVNSGAEGHVKERRPRPVVLIVAFVREDGTRREDEVGVYAGHTCLFVLARPKKSGTRLPWNIEEYTRLCRTLYRLLAQLGLAWYFLLWSLNLPVKF